MQIDVGCFYFIKDKFFEIIQDPELMQNKEMDVKGHVIIALEVKQMKKLYGSYQ